MSNEKREATSRPPLSNKILNYDKKNSFLFDVLKVVFFFARTLF